MKAKEVVTGLGAAGGANDACSGKPESATAKARR